MTLHAYINHSVLCYSPYHMQRVGQWITNICMSINRHQNAIRVLNYQFQRESSSLVQSSDCILPLLHTHTHTHAHAHTHTFTHTHTQRNYLYTSIHAYGVTLSNCLFKPCSGILVHHMYLWTS